MIPALIIAAVLIVFYCILYSMLNASGAADDRAFYPEASATMRVLSDAFSTEKYEKEMVFAALNFDAAQKALEDQFAHDLNSGTDVPYADVQQYATQEIVPVNKA